MASFDPQALTSLTGEKIKKTKFTDGFDPQALTSLTAIYPSEGRCAVVSIHRLLRA